MKRKRKQERERERWIGRDVFIYWGFKISCKQESQKVSFAAYD